MKYPFKIKVTYNNKKKKSFGYVISPLHTSPKLFLSAVDRKREHQRPWWPEVTLPLKQNQGKL